METKCPRCGEIVMSEAHYCPKCGKYLEDVSSRPTVPMETPDNIIHTKDLNDIEIVHHKAIWAVHKGQIGRRISESELAQLGNLEGIVIQEGCKALVYVDGVQVCELSGGTYEFPQLTLEEYLINLKKAGKQAKQIIIGSRRYDRKPFLERGLFSYIWGASGPQPDRSWGLVQFLFAVFFGRKYKETQEEHNYRTGIMEERLDKLNKPKLVRVVLVRDSFIPMTFGGKFAGADQELHFQPITVPTRLVDIQLAISLRLQIKDPDKFYDHYLLDSESVSTIYIHNELAPVVELISKDVLRNKDYSSLGLKDTELKEFKERLKKGLNEHLYGINVDEILEISDSSEVFARFRAVERDLYCSEVELKHLQRTGDYRNLLAMETNRQKVNAAQNEEDLRKALLDIDKDKILHDDEMDHFVKMIQHQRLISEAKTQEEAIKAINDLEKEKILSDDEVAAIKSAIEQKAIDRQQIADVMRVQATQKVAVAQQVANFIISDNDLEHKLRHELLEKQHALQLVDIDVVIEANRIEIAKKRIDLSDYEEHLALKRKETENEIERKRLQGLSDISTSAMAKMAELERQDKKIDYEHEEKMAGFEVSKSPAQLMAERIENLNPGAQEALAKSLSSQYDQMQSYFNARFADLNANAQQKEELMKQVIEMMKQSQRDTIDAVLQAQKTSAGVLVDKVEDAKKRGDEYREDAQHQQQRLDETTDKLVGHVTHGQGASSGINRGTIRTDNPDPKNPSK